MCDIENINKIAKFLKVSPVNVDYNNDKILTRTLKNKQKLSGYATIVQSLAKESNADCVKNSTKDLKTECQVSQWIDYAVLFVSASSKDKHVAVPLLKELNKVFSTKSYLVGNSLTLADLAVFYSIYETMLNLSQVDKENYINLSRWYDHLQQNEEIRQNGKLINVSTIRLFGWVTGTHI